MRSKQKSTASKPRLLRVFQGFLAIYALPFLGSEATVVAVIPRSRSDTQVSRPGHNCVQLPE
jgi:hypothetical protein